MPLDPSTSENSPPHIRFLSPLLPDAEQSTGVPIFRPGLCDMQRCHIVSLSSVRKQKNSSFRDTKTQRAECTRKHSTLQQHLLPRRFPDSPKARAKSWTVLAPQAWGEGTAGPLQNEAFPTNRSSQQTRWPVPKSIPTNNSAVQASEESAINLQTSDRQLEKQVTQNTTAGTYVPPYLA